MEWEVRQSPAFKVWVLSLRDRTARAIILRRIDRIAVGNFGDVKAMGGGVSELRVNHGPGYRIYFVRRGETLVVILCGGDKGSQSKDVARAKALAQEI
ncbi:MAG TPA: type II toxin-antitoxin system RelE/ParE family toxin [Caulobacter sp.]|nr:type II toxin-antitoxin system RelE/ParE family toxin [Caulobacter sp.]